MLNTSSGMGNLELAPLSCQCDLRYFKAKGIEVVIYKMTLTEQGEDEFFHSKIIKEFIKRQN
jgi:hypothetical protein